MDKNDSKEKIIRDYFNGQLTEDEEVGLMEWMKSAEANRAYFFQVKESLNPQEMEHPLLQSSYTELKSRLLINQQFQSQVFDRVRKFQLSFSKIAAMLIVGLAAIALARKTAPRTIALITSLIVIDIFVVGAGVGLEKVIQRIQDTEVMVADEGRSESIEARTEAARISLPMVQDYPLVGTGGGSFYNVFMSYRTPTYGYVYIDHTHNDFVEIATDYGLVGFAILGVLAALTLATVLRVMARRKSRVAWGIAFGVAMAIVGLFIHSTVDFNLQIPANALTIVVILAMGWVTPSLPRARLKRAKKAQEIEEKDELT